MPGRRLLLIAAEFPPRGGGGVLRVTKLVKYLSRLGWEITVICSDEPPSETDDPTLLEQVSSARILRVRGPLRSLGAAAKSAVEERRSRRGGRFLWDAARSFARAFAIPDRWIGWSRAVARLSADQLGNPDVIVSSGPPHSGHIAARSISRRLGVPFFVDLRDDWAGNPLFASSAPWRTPIDRVLERRALRDAAGIVVVSEASQALYAARYPSLAGRIHVIHNGFDREDLPTSAVRAPSDGRVHFLHAGSLRYAQRDPGPFFEAFGSAASANRLLVLHLLGSISPSNEARARTVISGQSLSIDGFVSHDEALRRMADADVLVVISSVSESGAGALTGKIFECLAAGRPLLLIAPPGPASDLVREADGGVIARPTDVPGLTSAILSLAANAGSYSGPRSEVLMRFDRGLQTKAWNDLLASHKRPNTDVGSRKT